jgi:hypothetical protein
MEVVRYDYGIHTMADETGISDGSYQAILPKEAHLIVIAEKVLLTCFNVAKPKHEDYALVIGHSVHS